MATARGVNNTKAQAGPNFAPVTGGDGGGKPGRFYDEFVIPAAGPGSAQNDIVIMGVNQSLKKGDRVLGVRIDWDAMGAGVTLAVGDDGSAARYQAAQAANAAGQNGTLVNGILGFQLTQDRDIQVTIGGGAPTAGAKFRLSWEVLRA